MKRYIILHHVHTGSHLAYFFLHYVFNGIRINRCLTPVTGPYSITSSTLQLMMHYEVKHSRLISFFKRLWPTNSTHLDIKLVLV